MTLRLAVLISPTIRTVGLTLLCLVIGLASVSCGGPQERKAAYRARAESFVREGNLPKARVALRNVLKIDPKDTDAYLLWAQIEESEHNWRNAFAHYLRILEISPDHERALIKIGKFYLEARELDKVKEIADKLDARFPGHVTAASLRIGATALGGREEEAHREAQTLASRYPASIDASLLLANLNAGRGHYAASIDVLTKALAEHPRDIELLGAMAAMHIRSGDLAPAEPILKTLIEQEPAAFEHRMKLARYYDERQLPNEAVAVLQEAVRIDPANEARYLTLSDYLAKRRGNTEAELALRAGIEQLPRSTNLQFALGNLYEQTTHWDRAREIYHAVTQQHQGKPPSIDAQVKLARLAWLEGRTDEATSLLRSALQDNPRSSEGLLLQGRMALKDMRYQDAIQALRMVVKDQPDQASAHLLLGQAYLGSGDSTLAKESIERAVTIAPKEPEARHTLALLHAKSQRIRDAKEQLDWLLQDDPLDLKTLALLTQILLESGQWDAAASTASRFQVAGAPALEMALIEGQIAEGRKDLSAAVRAYTTAVNAAPTDPRPLIALVHVYGQSKDLAAAQRQISALLTRYPSHPYAHSLMGEVKSQAGLASEADAHFQESIRHNPSWTYAWLSWASHKVAHRQSHEAIRILTDALAQAAQQEDIRLMLASLYSETNNTEAAIKEYETLLAKQPRMTLAANNLATLLVEARQDSTSLARAFALAKDLRDTSNPVFQDTAGWVFIKMGQIEEGIGLLTKALAQLPDQPQFLFHLGQAYHKSGKTEQARAALEKALHMRQDFPGHAEARALLNDLSHHTTSGSSGHAQG